MLNAQDLQFILQIMSSDRLTLNGAEARGVAVLQERLSQELQQLQNPTPPPAEPPVPVALPDDDLVDSPDIV